MIEHGTVVPLMPAWRPSNDKPGSFKSKDRVNSKIQKNPKGDDKSHAFSLSDLHPVLKCDHQRNQREYTRMSCEIKGLATRNATHSNHVPRTKRSHPKNSELDVAHRAPVSGTTKAEH